LVSVGAERAAAIRHDLVVGGQLGEALLELRYRYGARSIYVAGVELFARPDVDEDDLACAHAGEELVWADRVDLGPEILLSCTLNLRQARDRCIAQRQPE
jgi:hypothetical protein